MRRFVLVGHGGFHNRGCEAIVRSTVHLLREQFGDVEVTLSSRNPASDAVHPAAAGLRVIPDTGLWRPLSKVLGALSERWPGHNTALSGLRFASVGQVLEGADAVLSIGGDNLTMSPGFPWTWIDLHGLVHRRRRPLVVWGASIGPFPSGGLEDVIARSLRRASLICVRESATERYLTDIGVVENVRSVADPAFLLEAEPVETAGFWPTGADTLALNVSPYLDMAQTDKASALVQAGAAVRWATAMGLGVLLVPHVLGRTVSDAAYMAGLLTMFGDDERVRMMPTNLNACQTKFVISRCRFLVAARTHATIAGFSLGVPTISLAYSQKAIGLNSDLYGHCEWLVDWRVAQDVDAITRPLARLLEREDEVRRTLTERAEVMRSRAKLGVRHLAELV